MTKNTYIFLCIASIALVTVHGLFGIDPLGLSGCAGCFATSGSGRTYGGAWSSGGGWGGGK